MDQSLLAKMIYYKKQRSFTKTYIDEEKNFHERLKKFDNIPKLSKDESDSLEGHITNAEVLNFLKHMKNDKSPGPDGFTCEFFNFWGKDIGTFITRAINNSYNLMQFT